jgi:hypothetical protein
VSNEGRFSKEAALFSLAKPVAVFCPAERKLLPLKNTEVTLLFSYGHRYVSVVAGRAIRRKRPGRKRKNVMGIIPMRPFDLADPKTLVMNPAAIKPKDIATLVGLIEADIKANPTLGALPVTTGWNDITPAIALDLLRRNRPGANRKVDPATVAYYAAQMIVGDWKATGQPMLIDSEGRLVDSQHRNLAIVVSGATIKSFVVTGVEAIPALFAYIDNSRPRSAASALQTAGLNGVSPIIVKVIKLAEEIRAGVYNPDGGERLARLTPAQIIKLSTEYPNARDAARATASDWESVVSYVSGGGTSRKDVIAYMGMKIIDLYGNDVADDFFEEIVNDDERPTDHPVAAFRKLIDGDIKHDVLMKRHHLLAALIKTFNAWRKGEVLGRRWMLQVNEALPVLDTPRAEAAE